MSLRQVRSPPAPKITSTVESGCILTCIRFPHSPLQCSTPVRLQELGLHSIGGYLPQAWASAIEVMASRGYPTALRRSWAGRFQPLADELSIADWFAISLRSSVYSWRKISTKACMNVILISTYELGHQPFGLASPSAWLQDAGAHVVCLDLAVQPFAPDLIESAGLVAFYVPMHTATRLAGPLIEQVRALNPAAHV